jgi:hypothetical protein
MRRDVSFVTLRSILLVPGQLDYRPPWRWKRTPTDQGLHGGVHTKPRQNGGDTRYLGIILGPVPIA